MNQAIKSIRTYQTIPAGFLYPSNQLGQKTSVLRFKQVTTASSNPENPHDMDKAQSPNEKSKEAIEHGDVMSHSFGQAYATRSDEEGFGGIYGGNQSCDNDDDNNGKKIHENHPDYDRSQGSEVKEKEKGRNSTKC
ncbi:hypothetical protein JCGZ_00340 [Jatropha curcas]|uniref:Uncharacterized protein n=1 Tax=Jatropha curcas TaxID=180498 RepID=A0A067JT80_JATCU|nr:uncharacterized protein LOC105647897 [Jatropha curcas]KDP23195.1 hypothetical protein JCGZ_00340 [Jatropha curcas]